jgi:phosphatidylinositol alpha 1,6-mannosyltransferase
VSIPRVAFFSDSFHEVNGVAHTSRQFVGWARKLDLPFFSVRRGPETRWARDNQIQTLELQNSWASVRLEKDLWFDLLFLRHRNLVERALERFQPDLIHITGPSQCGILGMIEARHFNVPLVASWHTNLHEYAGRRLESILPWLPSHWRERIGQSAEALSLEILLKFYARADLLLAPNQELISLLANGTGLPTRPMYRGIDHDLFSPGRRTRSDDTFVIGYVGRLSAEKNIRVLPELETALRERGLRNYRFLIVGHGDERDFLQTHLQSVEFTGVLHGEELARAYANMDAFVFPSTTDTFGNVVLEAMSSGVPAIVSDSGGPKFLVRSSETGYTVSNLGEFAEAIMRLYADHALLSRMRKAARDAAYQYSWPAVFEQVYRSYGEALASKEQQRSLALNQLDRSRRDREGAKSDKAGVLAPDIRHGFESAH